MKLYSEKEKDRLQQNLTTIRKVAGWTAAELGELIGVTKQTISNLENNKTPMTKTQYIAIRAILDDKISTEEENSVLAQVVSILLDSGELSEEEQAKVDAAVTYVTGAKEKGMDNAAISAGLAGLIAALGIVCAPAAPMIAAPLWLRAITAARGKKKAEGNGVKKG